MFNNLQDMFENNRQNIETIANNFESILQFSQGYNFSLAASNKIIAESLKQKDRLRKMYLRDNLIYSTYPNKVHIELDDEEKNNKVYKLIQDMAMSDLDDDFISFVQKNKKSFFENKVTDNCGYANIPVGSKLIKSFKFFFEDKTPLRKWQDRASAIIQENKLEGYLCYSVHPIDFLTMSNNNSNWSTCHSLDHEYRAGNLGYMLDQSTMVCYITNKLDFLSCLPDDKKWNDKIWRMLIHFSEDGSALWFSKQYPFSLDSLRQEVLNNLPSLQAFSNPIDVIVKDPERKLVFWGGYEEIHNVIQPAGLQPQCFCDAIAASTFTPVVSLQRQFKQHNLTTYICGDNICPYCGKRITDQEIKDDFICDDCFEKLQDLYEQRYYCEICGKKIYEYETHFVTENGTYICEECYETREGLV